MTTYAGGKQVIGKAIANAMQDLVRRSGYNISEYWEPFVGMCGVMKHVDFVETRYGSDIHFEVIDMWNQLKQGWEPPQNISAQDYDYLKKHPEDKENCPSHLRGFVGHGYGYGGVYFAAFKPKYSEYDKGAGGRAYRGIKRTMPKVQTVNFFTGDYLQVCPLTSSPALIYCDPPYRKSTRGIGSTRHSNSFDHEAFWEWIRKMSQHHLVAVSELEAPEDFVPIWQKVRGIKLGNRFHKKNKKVTENLFVHRSRYNQWYQEER